MTIRSPAKQTRLRPWTVLSRIRTLLSHIGKTAMPSRGFRARLMATFGNNLVREPIRDLRFWLGWTGVSRMTPEELFTAALGLGKQWRVAECRFEGEPKRLELRIEHVPGEHFECPHCKALCGVHDTIERRWRHLNFFQYRCELVAKVPRTWCRTDGVHQVQVPWAREGSGFSLMMEALMMVLSAEMPVDAMADLIDEHDTRLWRVLIHYVEQAHAKSDWSAVGRIAVDETSARRGHRYVTNVLDAENSRLLLMVEGRSSEALGAFAKALREHGGDPSQIKAIAMDMSPAYVKGATDHFPQARIVFDKFHLMVLAGQATGNATAQSGAFFLGRRCCEILSPLSFRWQPNIATVNAITPPMVRALTPPSPLCNPPVT